MKTLTSFLLLITVVMFSAISCEEEGDDNNNNNNMGGTATITVNVDGKNYSFTVNNAANIGGTLNIGTLGEGAQLQVNNPSVNTFKKDLTGNVQMSFKIDNNISIAAYEGEIEISKLTDNKAEGTFFGLARDVTDIFMSGPIYTFTNGTFNSTL